jgi:hypothetical protein
MARKARLLSRPLQPYLAIAQQQPDAGLTAGIGIRRLQLETLLQAGVVERQMYRGKVGIGQKRHSEKTFSGNIGSNGCTVANVPKRHRPNALPIALFRGINESQLAGNGAKGLRQAAVVIPVELDRGTGTGHRQLSGSEAPGFAFGKGSSESNFDHTA